MPKKHRIKLPAVSIQFSQITSILSLLAVLNLYLDYKGYKTGDIDTDIIYVFVTFGLSTLAYVYESFILNNRLHELELGFEHRMNNLSFQLYNSFNNIKKQMLNSVEVELKKLADDLPQYVVNTVLSTYLDAVYTLSGIGYRSWREAAKLFSKGKKTPLLLLASIALVKADREINPYILSAFLTYVGLKINYKLLIPIKALNTFSNKINKALSTKEKNEKIGYLQRLLKEEIQKIQTGG